MPNPLSTIKDRRKPWHKELRNLKLARCGSMLAETAAEWGHANDAAARAANNRAGRYNERPATREVQYYLHMNGLDVPHSANVGYTFSREAVDWLVAKGLM